MSKVSVIVPIYNAQRTLDKCIKSILNQSFQDFELLLVNDGSMDNSLVICKKYLKYDNRIRIIDKSNEGCTATRKKGVAASVSEYIMFVDADDWIKNIAIETLYNESIRSSADVTVCNMYKVLGNSMLIKKKNMSVYFEKNRTYNKSEIKRELVVAYFHGHPFPSSLCAKLYKKELLLNYGNYLTKIHFLGEDLFYNLEILINSKKVSVINKPLYFYRHGGFTSKYMPYLFDDMVNGYQIQKQIINEYFQETKQKQYNGISIMLLNTFKTSLNNLFNSNLNESEIKELIKIYVSNSSVKECLNNKGSINYFSLEYINAIKSTDIKYLYQLGEQMYKSKKNKRALANIISKFSFI